MTRAVGKLLGEQKLEERLEEIRDIIKRMDTRWDHGFFAGELDYLEQLTPVPDDELQRAADMLENFGDYWDNLKDDPNGRPEFVWQIVERKTSQAVADVVIELLKRLSVQTQSIPADNGKEFADHERIAHDLRTSVYFAHPYSSWERATNENLNGLVRQYFP
ncbi:MAG: IS30 family transposase [Candidatus Promineifilaceae bacterium]